MSRTDRKELELTDEQVYRNLPFLSYSALKDFDTSPMKFYKKHILKQEEKTKDDIEREALILGNIVDGLTTLSQIDFDKKFSTIDCIRGNGQLWDVGDYLWILVQNAIKRGEDYVFTDLFNKAFDFIKYDKNGKEVAFKGKTCDFALESFDGSDVEALFKERKEKIGQDIITYQELQKAETIKEVLMNTTWTRDILNKATTKDFEVIKQLQCTFTVSKTPIKSMLDLVHVNHKKKTIKPYDIKCSWAVQFFSRQYMKMKYYLQIGTYYMNLRDWADNNKMGDYEIEAPSFIVADSTLQVKPLIWDTTMQNVAEGYSGFETKNGYKYRGVEQLVRDIEWHIKMDDFAITKEAYEREGHMLIYPFESYGDE